MASRHSFDDVSASVDMMEVKNAIEISKKKRLLLGMIFKGVVAKR